MGALKSVIFKKNNLFNEIIDDYSGFYCGKY